MSRRRRSGTSLLEGAEEIAQLQAQQFDDFRRRHSRQNKQIISENIVRNLALRSLQDQVNDLQGELLEARRQNRELLRIIAQKDEDARLIRGQNAIETLDCILSAIPGLRQMRDALAASAALQIPTPSVPPMIHNFVNPTATRPAASAADNMGLGTLDEALEEESPEPSRRRSHYNSPKRDSPRRTLFKDAHGAPGSGSPSPKRTPRKNRKRRESGLLLPGVVLAAELDSPVSSPSAKPTAHQLSLPASPSTPSRDKNGERVCSLNDPQPSPTAFDEDAVEAAITPKPNSKLANLKVKDIAAHYEERLAASSPSPVASPPTRITQSCKRVPVPKLDGEEIIIVPKEQPKKASSPKGVDSPQAIIVPGFINDGYESAASDLSPPPPDASIIGTSTPPAEPAPAPPVTLADEQPAAADEDEGRSSRRTRGKVVSYKEPSLNKKMRKPDGTATDDLLGIMTRAEPAVTGVRRKSALPRSTTRIVLTPSDMSDDTDEGKPTKAKGSLPSEGSCSSAKPKAASSLKVAERRRISPSSSRAALTDLDSTNTNANTDAPARRTTATAAAEKRRRSAV